MQRDAASRNHLEDYHYGSAEAPHTEAYLWRHIIKLSAELNARRVVDIGCGNGALCRELATRGYEVVGCEPSAKGVHFARSSARLRRTRLDQGARCSASQAQEPAGSRQLDWRDSRGWARRGAGRRPPRCRSYRQTGSQRCCCRCPSGCRRAGHDRSCSRSRMASER